MEYWWAVTAHQYSIQMHVALYPHNTHDTHDTHDSTHAFLLTLWTQGYSPPPPAWWSLISTETAG